LVVGTDEPKIRELLSESLAVPSAFKVAFDAVRRRRDGTVAGGAAH